jgi:oxaloacetate decarboxylase alpha subunit
MEAAKKEVGSLVKNQEELLMYIMFPQVAKDFLEGKVKVEDMSVQVEKKPELVKEEPVVQEGEVQWSLVLQEIKW